MARNLGDRSLPISHRISEETYMLGFRTKFPYANTSIVEQNKLEDSGFPCYNFLVFLLNYCLKMLKTPSSIIATNFISKVAILLMWSCLFNVCYAQSDDADASASVQVRVFLEGLIDSRIPLRITGLEQDTTIKLEDGNSPENMTEVEVTIEGLSTQTTITITPEKEGVVSTSPTSISLGFQRDGNTRRTATFTLTAENVGGTTVTISVMDNLGNEAEIKIQVVVDPPFPEMVRVPGDPTQSGALSFLMGSLEDDDAVQDNERPQREVNIPYAFEVSQYEVTREEFAAFVNDSSEYSPGNCTGLTNNWRDPGFTQTDDHPVVCVSWEDAKEYVDWLSDETGHNYRLLTEAEWEYAARAGTTSTYYFGDMIDTTQANFGISGDLGPANNQVTKRVGSYRANNWGLYDVHGNVAEWVEDCWHANYEDAPSDGSAWTTNCTNNNNRVIRGGSWADTQLSLRSAARASARAVETNRPRDYGFRVALNPLSITSFVPAAILLHAGGDILPTTQVEVSIKEIYTEENVTMTLELNDGGDDVVSTNTITIAPDGDSIDRSAAFTLSTTGIAGNTTVTLVVTDGRGYGDEVKIPVVVRPVYPEMVRVSPGTFTMGAPLGEANSAANNERPQREVNINYFFEVGKYEVTRGQFAAFVDDIDHSADNCTDTENNWQNPNWAPQENFTQTDDHPVVCVSWNNAQAYAKWLSGKTGHNYRLLTEAEWEYVARAGTTTAYHFANDALPNISKYARYQRDGYGTIAVGSLRPNDFELHDVHGNVWEWVEDCWADYNVNTLTDGSAREGCGPTALIVRRGGSWSDDFGLLRSANRSSGDKDGGGSTNFNGFRIAFTPLEITAPPSDRVELNITNRDGEKFFDTRLLAVNIEETHTDEPVEVSLQLDEGGGNVVSISTSSVTISTTSITIILPSNDSKDRTATFTLTAVGEGNTTATLAAKDNLGNMHTVKIPVVVEEVVIVDALTRLENDPFFDKMVRVPPGTFIMGSREDTGEDDERPQHEVTIPYAFEVGQYEVTRGQYRIFIEETGFRPADSRFHSCQSEFTWQDPRFNQTDDHPVVCIGWMDAVAYVAWLSSITGDDYRLLSEEEWEYAARAGTTSTYSFGDTISRSQANYSNAGTVRVGSYDPNEFGLYDVHGNVWEWVKDCNRDRSHKSKTVTDTDGKTKSTLNGRAVEGCGNLIARVIRGGSWSDGAAELRSANRAFLTNNHNNSRGFRIARTIPLQIINYPSEEIDLRVGGGRLATAQVEVVIRKTDTNKPVTVELQLDDDSIVSTGSIEVLFRDDDNEQRTVRIPLTAKKEGNTTLTVVVTDDAGNKEEIEIRLAVAPSLKIVSQTSDEVNLVVRGEHLATTQVEVVIQKIPTGEPVTVSLQLDKEGEPAVSGSTSSITLLSSDDNVQRTAKFTLSVESKGNTTLDSSGGNTTLTVVVRDEGDDEGDNDEEIELRLAAIEGNTTLTVVVTDKDGNEEEIEIRVVVEAFLPEMVRVQTGRFKMGSDSNDRNPQANEMPQHPVTISKPFEVGKYEVTRRQFEAFVRANDRVVENCGTENNWENPGFTQNNDHPVVCVSWDDAQAYVGWLSDLTGQSYRLLTEAEWEYAARAGTTGREFPYHFGNQFDVTLRDHANFEVSSSGSGGTTPVGTYSENAWGLHDVHGNAWEWVEDCWHPNYGEEDGMVDAPTDGTAWTEDCSSASSQKVRRGGSWLTDFVRARSASREFSSNDEEFNTIGFRVARDLP